MMNQLLPEARTMFERYLSREQRHVESPPVSKEWKEFISLVEKIDGMVEEKKRKVCDESPATYGKLMNDALNIKKNNDRVFSSSVALIAAGIEPWEFIDSLFALELMDFSIILVDDILDNAERRANDTAYHIKWGMPAALAVSEMLKAKAIRLILGSSISDRKKLGFLGELQDIQQKVYEGQLMDVQLEKEEISEISIQDYLRMISLTTGYQYRGFFRIGGLLSGKDDLIDILGKIGMDLGTLGQIRDDFIDYIPDEGLTWKSPFSDFKSGKKRLPLIVGWKNATPDEKRELLRFQKSSELQNDYPALLSILFKPKNMKEMKHIMVGLEQEGLGRLNSAPVSSLGKRLLATYFHLGTGEM